MLASAIIARIHTSGKQIVLEFTGAGSTALAALHAEPGSSRTVLEATDRYASESMKELLGATPEKNVDPKVAAAMAQHAYLRACRLGDETRPSVGVSCTATIATDRTKRGHHRCCVATQSHLSITTYDLTITKGARDRAAEEQLVSTILINAIAESVGVNEQLPLNLLQNEILLRDTHAHPDPIDSLASGAAQYVVIEPDGQRLPNHPIQGVIYSGSFNPLHFGHEALAGAAQSATNLPITFELPIVNAEKKALSRSELERRLNQFMRSNRVAVSTTPLFAEKSRLYPNCTFLVGIDTAARLIDPRFYNHNESTRDAALATMLSHNCKVLVAGRLIDGLFKTLDDLTIPQSARELFTKLPDFRADISASALRAKQNLR
jgi:nicotinic acid mononucleotide adenylyltransferase